MKKDLIDTLDTTMPFPASLDFDEIISVSGGTSDYTQAAVDTTDEEDGSPEDQAPSAHTSPETSSQDTMLSQDDCTSEKSTVKKRSRVTLEQLTILEDVFTRTVAPNSNYRQEIAAQTEMSERSIQVWFQNRRAKLKLQKRRESEKHESALQVNLALQAAQVAVGQLPPVGAGMPPSGFMPGLTRPQAGLNNISMNLASGIIQQSPQLLNIGTPNNAAIGDPSSMLLHQMVKQHSQKPSYLAGTMPMDINCDVAQMLQTSALSSRSQAPFQVLQIGSWSRLNLTGNDLAVQVNLATQCFTYEITQGGNCFGVQVPFMTVSSVTLKEQDGQTSLVMLGVTRMPR
jgi:hypothetical protein